MKSERVRISVDSPTGLYIPPGRPHSTCIPQIDPEKRNEVTNTNKRTNERTNGRTNERTKVPLCSTGHPPFGAAAQKSDKYVNLTAKQMNLEEIVQTIING